MTRQLSFIGEGLDRPRDEFGGSLLKNSHAKRKRPLSSKFAVHVVLRSKLGGFRRPTNFSRVNRLVQSVTQKYRVRLYQYANVGNHLHLLVKLPHVRRWKGFIRELTGRIAQETLNLRGRQGCPESFWSHRPFTRIARGWGRAYRTLKLYVQLNILEADGLISRRDFRTLRDYRAFFADG